MDNVTNPVIRKIHDDEKSLKIFDNELSNGNRKESKIIKEYPIVYIHNWKNKDKFDVYVGESNDFFRRTKEHYDASSDPTQWQHKLVNNDAFLYVIGHEHFNKSLTLDVENKLIHYMISNDRVKEVHNSRGNPQNSYYPMEEFDSIFTKIWKQLRNDNQELFPSESEIKDSAIYKASPLHKLTLEQKQARELILQRVFETLENKKRGQLIFVEGEAGTGKTVLNSSTFYELYCRSEVNKKSLNSFLLVNHNEQVGVYKQIAAKLGLTEKYGEIVSKPTTFINNHSIDEPVDVVFVDEGHLLLTQGKQSYTGNNQLQDIIDRSRVTVVMFDENQILTTEQFWEAVELEKFKEQAQSSNNYLTLKNQLRMHADKEMMEWIDAFTKYRQIRKAPTHSDYVIQIFDDPKTLEEAIRKKADQKDFALSRMVATYDWKYTSHKKSDPLDKRWEVTIGNWHKPWNYELERDLSKNEKKKIKDLAWAEQPQTIDEIGSTFTIQGFDLNYCGVILGPSVKYSDGKIIFDPDESCNQKAIRNRTLSDGSKRKFGDTLLQHEVRVLMTRGVNGMYIYACDDELRKALKNAFE